MSIYNPDDEEWSPHLQPSGRADAASKGPGGPAETAFLEAVAAMPKEQALAAAFFRKLCEKTAFAYTMNEIDSIRTQLERGPNVDLTYSSEDAMKAVMREYRLPKKDMLPEDRENMRQKTRRSMLGTLMSAGGMAGIGTLYTRRHRVQPQPDDTHVPPQPALKKGREDNHLPLPDVLSLLGAGFALGCGMTQARNWHEASKPDLDAYMHALLKDIGPNVNALMERYYKMLTERTPDGAFDKPGGPPRSR